MFCHRYFISSMEIHFPNMMILLYVRFFQVKEFFVHLILVSTLLLKSFQHSSENQEDFTLWMNSATVVLRIPSVHIYEYL